MTKRRQDLAAHRGAEIVRLSDLLTSAVRRAETAESKLAAVNALLKGRSSVQTVEVLSALEKEPTRG